jgi:hypothetical protein
MLGNDEAYAIRFYLREEIPEEHMHMMCGEYNGFMKTAQWSQNPHLSLTNYYRNVVLPNIKDYNYIEDEFYGKAQTECEYLPGENIIKEEPYVFKIRNWEAHKMFIYYPDNGINMSRVIHLDGRQSTQKFTSDDNHWSWTSIEDAKKIIKESDFFKQDKDII